MATGVKLSSCGITEKRFCVVLKQTMVSCFVCAEDEYADYNFDAMFLKRPDADRETESDLCGQC